MIHNGIKCAVALSESSLFLSLQAWGLPTAAVLRGGEEGVEKMLCELSV